MPKRARRQSFKSFAEAFAPDQYQPPKENAGVGAPAQKDNCYVDDRHNRRAPKVKA